jgi:hypothetical protein
MHEMEKEKRKSWKYQHKGIISIFAARSEAHRKRQFKVCIMS